MLVLGIETSTTQASVALCTQTEVVASYELGRGISQDQLLVPATQRLLADSQATWRQIGGIAVGVGPGLFTGLRVGIATAKAFAQTLGVAIVGLSSLDLLAHGVRHTRRLICPCVDARRSEVFWGLYRSVPGGVQRVSEFRCGSASHCANELEANGEPALVVGNGAQLYAEDFDRVRLAELAGIVDGIPRAVRVAELGVSKLLREEGHRLSEVSPMYIRKSDAEMTWEAAGKS